MLSFLSTGVLEIKEMKKVKVKGKEEVVTMGSI